MTRIYLLAIGIGTLALAGILLVVGMPRQAARTAAKPGVVVPLAVQRDEPRDSFWTLTSSAGMAYQRDGAWDLALTGLSDTVMRRSERPDLDAMLLPTSVFAGRWADWFDAAGTANGTLSFADGADGAMRSVVVEVSTPVFDGANGSLALRATLVDPVVDTFPLDGVPDLTLPASFTNAVLTLDGDAAFTHAIGPVTIAARPATDNTVAVEVRLADAVVASQVLTPVFPELAFDARSAAGFASGTLLARYAAGRADVALDAAPLTWALAGEIATEYRGTLGSW